MNYIHILIKKKKSISLFFLILPFFGFLLVLDETERAIRDGLGDIASSLTSCLVVPGGGAIELEISKYVDEALLLCAGNLSEFNNFQIAQGKPKTSAKIFDERVILNVNYPLTIIREEEKSRIAKFENEIPVRLGKIYNASSFIVSEHLKREICMSCLLDLQEKEKLSVSYGAMILKGVQGEPGVTPGSPAEKAGLKEGDIILEFGGSRITTDNTLLGLIRTRNVGDAVALKVLRNSKELTLTVTLEERK